ncbi:MAG: adenosylcobalamin-dependent ribonucleoside-diphosphate reductase [Gammaproteobacteria bacterium]|nr:adenosylcobalamin-dependent ribonucleoside-diphosphate reductase [Gammaproteobacteria bacterium]
MKAASIKSVSTSVEDIPFQAASVDIWEKKYRLQSKDGKIIDETIDDTYRRVANALADVEETEAKRKEWRGHFLWALRHGAIPAGRITSNAGALAYKPATSTINCTVSGTIHDSMNDILEKVHEAGLTLKAGCVAPDTTVVTEHGVVSAERAVCERHQQMLCYDRDSGRFEMRHIEEHMTTHVPRADNIEIVSNGTTLKTSIKHPVLVYRNARLSYVRADEVREDDGLVHHAFEWKADATNALQAWFAGAHLGDGSAYEKQIAYKGSRQAWAQKARAAGRRLVFKIRAAEREVVERYAAFFHSFCGSQAQVVATATPNGTPVWGYTVASFKASAAADLIDHQIGKKTAALRVPSWVAAHPERHFLPFLAGLIDTDGTVSTEHGSVTIAMQSHTFAEQLQGLLGLFGVHAAITVRKPREHVYQGNVIRDSGGAMLKISDSDFLHAVAEHMADSGKRRRIHDHASQSGQYDRYLLPQQLKTALAAELEGLGHHERQALGFYHGYHEKSVVSRIWLDRWSTRFPHLRAVINFARTLRPVETVRRNLPIGETFYDFTVEKHHNYLAGENGLMVIHNCGIGYEFSTLRPRGAFVAGAGAYTSGPLSFMDIYDKMCFTVSSAGGRRGAQMATFDVGHPDVLDFVLAKREDGRLRQFNLSLLITQEFIEAVKADIDWKLAFPLTDKEAEIDGIDLNNPEQVVWREWPTHDKYIVNEEGLVACKVYRTIRAQRLWDVIMSSTYDYAEPGFILIDKVNEMNNNWFCENIRATNPCGEQPLPPYGSCLLGSINLTKFVRNPFTDEAAFDWEKFRKTVAIFTRMLDNVVEINGLPLEGQREAILNKRRHGMGYLGLGSTLTLMQMKYGSDESLEFTERVTRELAMVGWETGVQLAEEKGPAPVLEQDYTVTAAMLRKRPEMKTDGYKVGDTVKGKVLLARYSRYMQQVGSVNPELVAEMAEKGCRFTHHSSIAPTGTISLSLANNASNGIEPSFAHLYSRNVIREGKKSKEKVDVCSFELLAYRKMVNTDAMPFAEDERNKLPEYFISADDIAPKAHVDIQAAAQKWIDSSISKTANVPTDFAYAQFKDIYLYAYEKGLKGCTTFRFNPEVFQGVLVKEQDLENTTYRFTLEDGSVVEVKGNEEIEYDGEMHSAANLYDALKEGYYGKF